MGGAKISNEHVSNPHSLLSRLRFRGGILTSL